MANTVADINTDVRSLLNDSSGVLLTDAFLLPLINLIYSELQSSLRGHGLPVIKEQTLLTVVGPNNNPTITEVQLPGLINPIELFERPVASQNDFNLVREAQWSEDALATNEIQYWTWRNNIIYLSPINQSRELKIRYLRGFAKLLNNASVIEVLDARPWLSNRVAVSAALSLGATSRAEGLAISTTRLWDTFITNAVRETQSLPVRKKPFRRNSMRSR